MPELELKLQPKRKVFCCGFIRLNPLSSVVAQALVAHFRNWVQVVRRLPGEKDCSFERSSAAWSCWGTVKCRYTLFWWCRFAVTDLCFQGYIQRLFGEWFC